MSTSATVIAELPLFPLQAVLFPQGLLGLKVFEARYLDLASSCLREGTPFGVVHLLKGAEAGRKSDGATFDRTGCLAHIDSCDSEQPGILQLRCRGGQRFRLTQPRQRDNGLWLASAELIDDDAGAVLPAELAPAAIALGHAIKALQQQGSQPFLAPYRLQEPGWVANRWCEILPISTAARQKLMELEDPVVRLRLVDEFLRSRGVIEQR
jgi:uncharacterized protein